MYNFSISWNNLHASHKTHALQEGKSKEERERRKEVFDGLLSVFIQLNLFAVKKRGKGGTKELYWLIEIFIVIIYQITPPLSLEIDWTTSLVIRSLRMLQSYTQGNFGSDDLPNCSDTED